MRSTARSGASSTAQKVGDAPSVSRPFGAAAAVGLGLLIALAATLSPSPGSPGDAVARRVTVGLSGWVLVAVFGSLILAETVVIAFVLAHPRRRRKKGDDEHEMYHEPRRVPPLLAIVLIGLALALAAALVGILVWLGRESSAVYEHGSNLAQHLPAAPPAGNVPSRQSFEHGSASVLTTGLVAAVAAVAVFGSLFIVVWLVFGDRWRRRLASGDGYRAQVAEAIDASLDELGAELDARVAIQKIYRNFERVLSAAAIPRRTWQTPLEYMRSALARLPVPREPLAELTQLFEIARFSTHPMANAERDRAGRSLTAIRTSIEAAAPKEER